MTRPAYMVIVGTGVRYDRLQAYRKALDAADLYSRFGGKFVIARRPSLVLDGTYPDDRLTLVVRFPDLAAARGFWHGEYQQILPMRAGAGDFNIGVWEELPNRPAMPVSPPGVLPAFMLVVAWNIKDAYRRYSDKVRSSGLLDRLGAVPIIGGPPAEMFEGTYPDDRNTVLLRYGSLQSVRDFWSSPDYAEIKPMRANAADIVVAAWERQAVA